MLTKEQLAKIKEIVQNADSVFDAYSDIHDYLGRDITSAEAMQMVDESLNDMFANDEADAPANGGSEASNEAKAPQSIDTSATEPKQSEPSFTSSDPTDNVARHRALLDYLSDVYRRKNHDYGDSFARSVRRYGLVAALTRLSDKWQRAENLFLHANSLVADEGLRDTLLDMANYCIMTVMVLDEKERK